MRLRAQRRGRRRGRKGVGVSVEERVHRVAQTVGLDCGRNGLTDGPAELFRQSREPRRAAKDTAGFRQHPLAHARELKGRQQRAHVAERFVEGGDFHACRVEQLRLERIEQRMPELVAHDVGTLAGKDRPSRARTMEELQALAVIEGVEVGAEIEVHRQDRAHLPRYPRQQCPPEIRAATQCFGGSPVAKLCSSRRMRLGVRSRGRVRNSDRKRRIPQNGDRPLDDLASARLSTGAGIVLPSVDHALRLRPAFRGCRTRSDFALTTRSRRL